MKRDISCLYLGTQAADGIFVRELRESGFRVTHQRDDRELARWLTRRRHDFLFISIKLPDNDSDGIAVLDRLRRSGDNTPAIMLSDRTDVSERVRALNAGADDVLCLPLPHGELMARIKALLRRCFPLEEQSFLGSAKPEGTMGRHADRLRTRLQDSSTKICRSTEGYFI